MIENKYIILYADEFDMDVWCRYMDILNLSHTEEIVKILIKDIFTINN